MTAKRRNLTFLTHDAGKQPAIDTLNVPAADKRAALAKRRGGIDFDPAKFSDDEIEILWTSMSEQARRQYLGIGDEPMTIAPDDDDDPPPAAPAAVAA